MLTYDLTYHFMVELETIIAFVYNDLQYRNKFV